MSEFSISDADVTIEVECKLHQVRVYKKSSKNPDNYNSAFQIFVYGDRGMAWSINGPGFYAAKKHLPAIMMRLGLTVLEGYVTDAHARLIARMLRDSCNVTTPRRGLCSGRDMPWVEVRLKSNHT